MNAQTMYIHHATSDPAYTTKPYFSDDFDELRDPSPGVASGEAAGSAEGMSAEDGERISWNGGGLLASSKSLRCDMEAVRTRSGTDGVRRCRIAMTGLDGANAVAAVSHYM